ncbi:hypothetical protein JVU11DRAFT_11347 [Chiua virens]|nr:hypothetical protein JVU11DRAFT_11347 [Chiua virens]
MPNLTIINNLDEAIHVAFFIVAPAHWKNNLQPGERWTRDMPTLPLVFQARWVERQDDDGRVRRSREFCPEDSWKMGATIGTACAMGTASVVIGAVSVPTGWGRIGRRLAGPLMTAANAGGAKYAAAASDDTKLFDTLVWVPWVEHKEYSVRMVDGERCGLWDVKENREV